MMRRALILAVTAGLAVVVPGCGDDESRNAAAVATTPGTATTSPSAVETTRTTATEKDDDKKTDSKKNDEDKRDDGQQSDSGADAQSRADAENTGPRDVTARAYARETRSICRAGWRRAAKRASRAMRNAPEDPAEAQHVADKVVQVTLDEVSGALKRVRRLKRPDGGREVIGATLERIHGYFTLYAQLNQVARSDNPEATIEVSQQMNRITKRVRRDGKRYGLMSCVQPDGAGFQVSS